VSNTAAATVIIGNKLGLHARPAMLFVEAASGYEAEITVRRTDQRETVDGKSIMQMMMLAATQGTKVEIAASGSDADTAVKALVDLVESKFMED
jgi:phosphotransferase system HPr (HPr) family protein